MNHILRKKLYILLEKKLVSLYNIIENKRNKFRKKNGGTKVATREKNIWILLVFLLSGLVIGGLLGELASKVDFLWWLSYGESFGLTNPITLNLNIMEVTFGLMFKINVASIIGMAIAIFIYRKV